tara:strand:- start:374 stop:619 length:246 start_codon:yes stop_codon:yes gene_type:complete
MKKITIAAEDIEITTPPEEKTNYTKVFESLQKHKGGLTSNELAEKSGVLTRRVTEAIKRMKHKNILKQKTCRCKRTAIYYL